MRTAPRRLRSLAALLVLAFSVGWMLLRRRGGPAVELAVEPVPDEVFDEEIFGEPAPDVPADVLATNAGLTDAAAAEPEPAGNVPADVLATDAGLSPAPAGRPAGGADGAAGSAADTGAADSAADTGAVDTGAADIGAADTGADTMVLPAQTPPDAPAPTGTDNLRAIRGIGPAIQRTLHELGITTFRQVAELDGPELDPVRVRLQDFRTRIQREDWVGQARRLHREKYGDDA